MIVEDKTTKTIANGMISESFFSVKQENLAHIFSILRNSLYSDKAGAIIREYSTNAYDAHVQAGIKDTPNKSLMCMLPMVNPQSVIQMTKWA